MQKYLQIGKIVNTHGIKGELKIIPLTDNVERYDFLEWVYVQSKGTYRKYYIESIRYHKGVVITKFKGVNDMDTALSLKNLFILVDRKNAIPLNQDSYFICDLVGCTVFEKSNNRLGVLADVIKTGSNDVYVVKNDSGKEILIPALKSVVTDISLTEHRITVELPEGIL
jgi:16S rRNA processing protein RimM